MAIKDYSSTAASNTSISGISIQGTADVKNFDNAMRQQLADIANWTDSDSIASASTTDLGSVEGMYVTVSGTATITGLGTLKAGMVKFVYFSGAGTITHNATSLILTGGASITRAAGDTAVFASEGSGNWRCLGYYQADGLPDLRSLNAPLITNADSLFTSGWYRVGSTWTGSPYAGTDSRNQGYLRVSSFATGTNEILQELTPIRATNDRRFRLFEAGVATSWFLRYSSKNLVGTVSQSSGVPTGAVIESGTSGGDFYVRYADGTQICTRTINAGTVSFSASGNVFASSAISGGGFLKNFTSAPVVPAPSILSSSGLVWATMATAPSSSSYGQFYLISPSSSSSSGTTLLLTATGKWF